MLLFSVISCEVFERSLLACGADAAAVFIAQIIHFIKYQRRLMFEDAELTDTVIQFDDRVTQGVGGHEPLVVVAAVAFVHDTAVVGLDDTKVFEGGTAGHDVCFVALG